MSINEHCPICKNYDIRIKWQSTHRSRITKTEHYRCTAHTHLKPNVYRCIKCDHYFITQPSAEILQESYEEVEDFEYLQNIEIKRKTFAQAYNKITRYLEDSNVLLEVGSYAGIFLKELQSHGFQALGVEPSYWGSEYAISQGLNVLQGTFENIHDKIKNDFDMVVSWDVLEHVKDPVLFMTLLSKKVKSGGYLSISTLDRDALIVKLLGKRWPWILPMHLHYFDKRTIKSLGERNGLQLVETGPHVHYATLSYILKRLGYRKTNLEFLNKVVVPVGLGDVRYFIFKKSNISSIK